MEKVVPGWAFVGASCWGLPRGGILTWLIDARVATESELVGFCDICYTKCVFFGSFWSLCFRHSPFFRAGVDRVAIALRWIIG